MITQKVGDRAGLYGKSRSSAQRPAKRGGRGDSVVTFRERLRSFARYLPFIGKVVLAVVAGVLIFAGYRAAASASFFQMRQVDVRGTSRASAEQIQQVVRRTVGQTGVWRADLSAVSSQLEHLPWVKTAVVSRLLPDGMRVRITERVSRAVVRTSAGHFVWVDEDAVVLGEMASTDQMPAFFLRGWSEENSADARQDNRDRVQRYLELARDWSAAGLAERVSEVNLSDLRDVRAQLAGDDAQIEVRLGSKDGGTRLKKGLDVLENQRHTPRGALISYVDLTQGKRAIVGFTSGAQINGDPNVTDPLPEKNAAADRAGNEIPKPSRKQAQRDGKQTRVQNPEARRRDRSRRQ